RDRPAPGTRRQREFSPALRVRPGGYFLGCSFGGGTFIFSGANRPPMASPPPSGWYSSIAICLNGDGLSFVGLSFGGSDAAAMIGASSGTSARGLRPDLASGRKRFMACWWVSLLYHARAAFLSSNQAKITDLPLAVRAVSTPRQPGLSLSAATRSGNPLSSAFAGLSSAFAGGSAAW